MSQCTSCALDTDEDIALDAALLLLSDEEKQRANRFHFVRDRERYIRGRGYLRQIVAGRLGLAAESLELQKMTLINLSLLAIRSISIYPIRLVLQC